MFDNHHLICSISLVVKCSPYHSAGHGPVGRWSSFSRPQMADPSPSNTYHLRVPINVPDADYDTQEVGGGDGDYAVADGGNTAGVEGDYMAIHEDNLTKTAPETLVTTVTKEPKATVVATQSVPPKYKTVYMKETHVRHMPVFQQVPVVQHTIKAVQIPEPIPPPPQFVPPPPRPPKMMIKRIPMVEIVRIRKDKLVLTDERDPDFGRPGVSMQEARPGEYVDRLEVQGSPYTLQSRGGYGHGGGYSYGGSGGRTIVNKSKAK